MDFLPNVSSELTVWNEFPHYSESPLSVCGGAGGGDDGLSVCLRARNAAHVSIYLWLSWT